MGSRNTVLNYPRFIQTDRLTLRPPYASDAPAVFEIHSNPETNQHNPAGPMKGLPEAHQRISEWINDWSTHSIGYWCVSTTQNSLVIGVSGVRVMEWSGRSVLNLYYRYGPEAWGKGYATEVAKEAVKAAQACRSDLPVIARIRPTNISSIRVAERVGLVRRPDLSTSDHVVYTSWWE